MDDVQNQGENQRKLPHYAEQPSQESAVKKAIAPGAISGEQVNKTITALQKPTSFLLFILMVILILEGIQYFESVGRNERLGVFLTEIETNRGAELRECGETIRDLTRRLERIKQTEGVTIQKALEKSDGKQ